MYCSLCACKCTDIAKSRPVVSQGTLVKFLIPAVDHVIALSLSLWIMDAVPIRFCTAISLASLTITMTFVQGTAAATATQEDAAVALVSDVAYGELLVMIFCEAHILPDLHQASTSTRAPRSSTLYTGASENQEDYSRSVSTTRLV
jgi:hypothetical protein